MCLFGLVQLGEDRGFGVISDFEVIEVEAVVEGLVEMPPDVVRCQPVEGLRVFQQVEGIF